LPHSYYCGGIYDMFLWFLFLLSCLSDQMMVYEVEKITYEEVERWHSEVNVYVEGDTIIVDTGQDAADIWVDNFTQPGNFNGVDILWVIDPSGSMANDRVRVIAGIGDMISVLPASDWRLAIISTDPNRAAATQQFPLIPGDGQQEAEDQMNLTVTGFHEKGFDAVVAYMSNGYSSTWMREDAALLVVFVSDEKEQSYSNFVSSSNFVTWISGQRDYVFISSIVQLGQEDTECQPASILNQGDRYMEAADAFNGQKIDICSEDWSQGVADAGTQITQYDYWELTHVPIYNDRIYVFIDGVPNYDWYYEPTENRVYFNTMPDEKSLVEIAYYYQ
jgi:hypothetical protein